MIIMIIEWYFFFKLVRNRERNARGEKRKERKRERNKWRRKAEIIINFEC